jgi:ferritin
MLKPDMEQRLNQHINEELYASYLYLSMSAFCNHKGMNGLARWLMLQSQEEHGHAMKIFGYIHEHGGKVVLKPIKEPQAEFSSYTALFEDVLAHEQKVTQLIHNLMGLAVELNDYPTQVFLQWFVQEQTEEEASADDALQKMKLVEAHPAGLLALDRELGARSAGG